MSVAEIYVRNTPCTNRSCKKQTYVLAHSVLVSVMVCDGLRLCMVALGYCWIVNWDESNWLRGFTYGAYPHQDNSQALIVAFVADVAVVIDMKRVSRAKFPLLLVDSRSNTVCKKCADKRVDAYFNISASTKYNTYNVYNTSNTCIDCLKRDKVNTPCTCCEHIVADVQSQKD